MYFITLTAGNQRGLLLKVFEVTSMAELGFITDYQDSLTEQSDDVLNSPKTHYSKLCKMYNFSSTVFDTVRYIIKPCTKHDSVNTKMV